MKKLFIVLLIVLLAFPPLSFADSIDLSNLSFDELVSLREEINLALWKTEEWQQVTVPAGTYIIGKDIPAGHWTIKPAKDSTCLIGYFITADFSGKEPADPLNDYYYQGIADPESSYASVVDMYQLDLVLIDGYYLSITYGDAIFEPYTGKPDLGFR